MRAMQHWLMKTEPDTFGIDDLARVKVEPWTGVRNYQARNFMRDQMKVGDRVLFYHSNATPPGVAGLAVVKRTGVVDATQFEPSSPYYDPGSKRDDPRWICVDVEFVEKLPRLIALDELRANPALDGMVLLQKGSRLSVQPVSAAHYKAVLAMAKKAAPKAKAAR
ncbi:MAG: EVE domain-containing protein [Myxococcales bacterium]|nr:EVE domain-containing protein [Myxococcales bacterium]